MDAAPLQAKVRPPLVGMIAQADEVQLGGLENAQDLFEGHLAVVGELGMAVQDSPILVPTSLIRHVLELGAECLPRHFLPRKADVVVV